MQTNINHNYDVIIIGSGIGGLTCGSYLAKSGMKVLIIEKHIQPGGYCTSFVRKGYSFDAAVHSLRGLKEKNQLGMIIKDLGLKNILPLIRVDPSDIVIFKNKRLYIYNNINATIESFKSVFPNQKKEIEKFFSFLCNTEFTELYKSTYKKTFSEVIDIFFTEPDIKTCFNILLGNLGLDSKNISALSALVFYNELFTDGGYYPKYGMQSFPNVLTQRIRDYGGDVLFNNEAEKIVIKNNVVKGVILKNGNFIESRIVISNIDAHKTYLKLVGKQYLNKDFIKHLTGLIVSSSAFIVYLGVEKEIKNSDKCCTLWYFPSQKSVGCYKDSFNDKTDAIGKYAICGLSSTNLTNSLTKPRTSITLTAVAPWKSLNFWRQKKEKFEKKIIDRANEILNIFNGAIDVREAATPSTLYRYTYNFKGALYGWASLPEQINKWIMPQKSRIRGLYLCGHWATRGWGQGGISMVANSGRTTAEMILRSCRMNKG